jgi:hypothetical protein
MYIMIKTKKIIKDGAPFLTQLGIGQYFFVFRLDCKLPKQLSFYWAIRAKLFQPFISQERKKKGFVVAAFIT